MSTTPSITDFSFDEVEDSRFDRDILAAEADGAILYKVGGRWVRDEDGPIRINTHRKASNRSVGVD